MKCIYLSTYITSIRDNNKEIFVENNSWDYIKEYCESIRKNNLNSLIFYNDLSDEFIEKHSDQNIQFIRFDISEYSHLQPHDIRFFLYRDYVQTTECKYIVMTDISDVVILQDFMNFPKRQKNVLFVGIEGENIMDNEWFSIYMDHINETYTDTIYSPKNISTKIFDNRIILNCGVIAGEHRLIVTLLQYFTTTFNGMYKLLKPNIMNKPLDMYVLNYVVYRYFKCFLYKGYIFTTPFAQNIWDETYFIKHK